MDDKTLEKFGGKVPVIDPYGRFGTIDLAEVEDAITNGGFKYASPNDINEFLGNREFGSGLENSAKAFAAGAARSATFGASDVALTQSGAVEPNTLKQLEKRHGFANFLGEVTGIAGSLVVAPTLSPVGVVAKVGRSATQAALPMAKGLAGLVADPAKSAIANRILTQTGAHAFGSSVEGVAYGLGHTVTEAALGDPREAAEHLGANLGYGALIGGAIGAALTGTFLGVKGLKEKFSPEVRANALRNKIITDAASTPPPPPPGSGPAQSVASMEVQGAGGKLEQGEIGPQGLTEPAVMPEINSLKDIRHIVDNSAYPNLPSQMAQRQALENSSRIIGADTQFPVTKLQLESLTNPEKRKLYKTILEDGSETGELLQEFESNQKNEAVFKIEKIVDSITPGTKVTSNRLREGQNVIDAFVSQYKAEQKALAPAFKEFDEIAVNQLADFSAKVAPIENAVPGISKYLEVKEGKLTIQPFSTAMGFTKETHKVVKDLLTHANNPKLTLGELRNVRESMRDVLYKNDLPPRTAQEITSLRKSLMDYMESAVQEVAPDLEVRETFKRYAINEENRSILENIFGGNITDKTTFGKTIGKTIKPEDVLDKIFSNSVTVNAAKQILGQKEFDKAIARFLKMEMAEATNNTTQMGFSSAKFHTKLRAKDVELTVAFAEKPEVLTKINAWTEKMRILPDSVSVNPSGTANTIRRLGLLEAVSKMGDILHPVESIKAAAAERLKRFEAQQEQQRLTGVIDGLISGKSIEQAEHQVHEEMVRTTFLGKLERMAQDVKNKIEKKAKHIFDVENTAGFLGGKSTPEQKREKFEKTSKDLHSLNNNPSELIEKLDKATKSTFAVAPNVSGQLQQIAATATQFLASKLPVEQNPSPLSKPFDPSQSEIAKFSRYQEVLDNPVSVLSHVKSGTLTVDHMEALQTVFPKLLETMRSEVMSNLVKHMAKRDNAIPYQKKLSLSAFLGVDLVRSLDPQFMLSVQTSLMNRGQEQARSQMQAQGKISKDGVGKIDQAKREYTPAQATALK